MFFLAINRLKPEVEPDTLREIIPSHIAWIRSRIADGTVIQSGKWGKSGGICIVMADSEEEARQVFAEDPIAQSGLFAVEVERFFPDVKAASYE